MSATDAAATAPAVSARVRSLAAAGQWRLTWRRFRRHRLAVACGVLVLLFYTVVLFAEFFATTDPFRPSASFSLMPPQTVPAAVPAVKLPLLNFWAQEKVRMPQHQTDLPKQ